MSEYERWLRWTAVLLLLAAVIAIGLIAAGAFDPRPIGTEQWTRPLAVESIAANSRRLLWLEHPLPDRPFSLRLAAAHHSGELDAGYGLILGDETKHLAVAVSPLGYVAIWQENILHPSSFILPWQPWPHVKSGAEANELWLDVDRPDNTKTSLISVRINRELLWNGEIDTLAGQIGLLIESFGETAVVDFQRLQLFTPPP